MRQSVLEDVFIDDNASFTLEDGFSIAFAFIDEELEMEPLDPSMGELKVKVFEWGYDADDVYYYKEEFLETHVCTSDELGITGQSSAFKPIKESSKQELNWSLGTLRCIDREESWIKGNS